MEMRRSDYWYFNNIFTPDRCQYIIDLGLKKGFHKGTVARKKRLNTKVRKSQVCFLHNQYLFDVINTYLPTANKSALWNYRYERIEDVQLTRYEKGDHYSWHVDSTLNPYTDPKKPNFYGKIRKISLVVPLSDPRTYKGGNFQFWSGKTLTIKEGRKQGSLLFFPSYLWHRVTPITEGIRYSLVAWICGDPFV